jgi:acyl-CoA thioester hydrolase
MLEPLPGVFLHRFTVPPAAIDANGHANNAEYVRWMQEAATAHSDARGWTLARYRQAGGTWVIRSHHIEYLRPAFAGEDLMLATWVGGFEARESPRHYVFVRARDQKILARARTLWVFVEAATGRATPIPDELRSAFELVPDEATVLRAMKGGA